MTQITRRYFRKASAAVLIPLLVGTGSPAALAASGTGTTDASAAQQEPATLLRASSYLGSEIVDLAGRRLGEAQDILVQAGSARFSHVIADIDSRDGVEGGVYAIPVGQLRHRVQPRTGMERTTVEPTQGRDGDALDDAVTLVLQPPASQLRTMARWDGSDRGIIMDMVRRDAYTAGLALSDGLYSFPLAGLRDTEVRNLEDKRLGELEDLVLDVSDASVEFAILEFDPGLLSGEENVVVPSAEFLRPTLDLEDGHELEALVLNMSQEDVRNLQGFDDNDWPDFRDTDTVGALHRGFVIQTRAQREKEQREKEELTFSSLDANLDGYINRSEAVDNSLLSRRWDRFDQNGDGLISRKEFAEGARLPKLVSR